MPGQLSLFNHEPENDQHIFNLKQTLDPISVNKDISGARLTDLVPEKATLALTRGYGIRAVQVGRILKLLQEKREEDGAITREEVGHVLSMTWAAAQSYINVMRHIGLIDRKTRITPFGSLVLMYSPFIDNTGVLWLLHYILGSNANLVLWSNLFNIAINEMEEFSIYEITKIFQVLDGRWSEKTLSKKVPRELGAILKTYSEDMFFPLRIINKEDTGNYQAFWSTGILPSLVWLSVLLVYRDRYYSGASALEVPLIVHGQYSPGRILRQNEVELRRALDDLHNADLLTVETRSGLDQVRFRREHTWLSTIAEHMQGNGYT